MSQREDLLAGARACLVEKGYHRTTARDIAAVSGSHLASIGYHFGSKDALMNLAALQAQNEWGDAIEAAVRAGAGAGPAQRLRIALEELISSLPRHRELVVATMQAYAQAEFDEGIRHALADAGESARRALAAMLLDRDPGDLDAETVAGVGGAVYATVVGLAVQSVLAPESLPTGEQAAAALRTLTCE
ncbi:TetR/AcrR family transcriptional regulator [Streptomonospora sp. PA3]|uniref:TetR/AcrR family transcriptional regulator n=1 Tax=Streptomonospora sp. PA3 TaxID=2607326 RepID=UPI0012DC62AB|nr:TetR/AcrR family transcriptional regulator [Streptomonospora sp. PA3]MUL41079.1 TetR/AcrR family transcriptional regulator [Streptomonospora sp. PA3]